MKDTLMKNILPLILALASINAFAKTMDSLMSSADYKWQPVQIGKEISSFPVSGMVIADEGAMHIQSARISGRALSLMNEEGGMVKQGQAIFAITGPECISIREEKRIAIHSKLEELVNSIAGREKELNIKVTERECLLLSDASGILVKRNIGSGNSFNQGDVLAQILEPEKMRVEVEVPEKSASLIARGTPVKFRLPSAPGFKGTSVIQQVFPIVEEGTRMMRARLHKANLPKETKLNSMVFADIELSQNHQCLIVPVTSVTFQDNNSWVLKKGSDLKRVAVNVLGNLGKKLLINPSHKDELKDGDIIATYNVPFLFQEVKKQTSAR
jgi:multidrug efflux pump subunit AcrA (membrane-fusion protein)